MCCVLLWTMQKYFSPSFWTAILLSILYKSHNTFNILLIVLMKTVKIYEVLPSYLHKYKYPFYCGAEMYSSLVFSVPWEFFASLQFLPPSGKKWKKFAGRRFCAKQFTWCCEMRREGFIFNNGFWNFWSNFLLSVYYLPNTDTTFQFLCWKSQDFPSYKYKAKYSFSHMYIQSPSQFSTFLDFSVLTPNPRKWHTFSTLPPPLLLCEHFPVTEMPFRNLP